MCQHSIAQSVSQLRNNWLSAGDRVWCAFESRVVFIAVEPPHVTQILKEISKEMTDDKIIVSLVAGVPLAQLQVQHMFPLLLGNPNPVCHLSGTSSSIKARQRLDHDASGNMICCLASYKVVNNAPCYSPIMHMIATSGCSQAYHEAAAVVVRLQHVAHSSLAH